MSSAKRLRVLATQIRLVTSAYVAVTTFTQEAKSLYRNDGGGFFSDRSYTSQVTQGLIPWVGFGVLFADVNKDGYLDLAMVNGHVEDLIHMVDPANDYPQPMKLFINRKDGTFEDASETTGNGFRRSIVGRALAVADWDNDGDPDFLAADLEGHAAPRTGWASSLWADQRATGWRSAPGSSSNRRWASNCGRSIRTAATSRPATRDRYSGWRRTPWRGK